ncbi:hypothetical protein, unlikely [Trypanosoma brucei gambiense DAL972]|uniref:Uncharacterized protein n=1 Tax=Trypanosoma brucei gambiense (strain MHOM/CI/86/DAL972) TaxID=679716 RepID=C9ZNK5_TRYB9|nr:hypothetical protein, unlikely [Trypanosoma brucei gambiense DAL972]CBH10983.1 hypothetical protein, unlikely [Trypanosoma brucei gambiense DAL972]|eukprot:XP_011773270.1 hypothetical protein, unlikely [Trypanosoma brucei gambiense DAL972]
MIVILFFTSVFLFSSFPPLYLSSHFSVILSCLFTLAALPVFKRPIPVCDTIRQASAGHCSKATRPQVKSIGSDKERKRNIYTYIYIHTHIRKEPGKGVKNEGPKISGEKEK